MIEAVPKPIQRRLKRIGRQIGHTPLVELTRLHESENVRIFAKWEWSQWSGSVKARAAYAIVKDGIERGLLHGEKHLLDATSGNTGIAYAQLCAALGIPVTLVLPENASPERKRMLRWHGVQLIYSPPTGRTDEAQEIASELANKHPDKYFYADQYNHPANPDIHRTTTASEILEQTNGSITHFVSGLGTTGTFTGVSTGIKKNNPGIQSVALQPDSPLHGLEGWKHLDTARIPGIFDERLIDQTMRISTEEAHEVMRAAAREEGLFLSPSSAANLAGALRLARNIEEGLITTIFPDAADRYGEIIEKLLQS